MTDGTASPSNAFLSGYLATRAGIDRDPTFLEAAKRLDPERSAYHEEIFNSFGGHDA
jgi:16S rRNA C1402 N4-methylase RsmH